MLVGLWLAAHGYAPFSPCVPHLRPAAVAMCASTELATLAAISDKTAQDKERILTVCKELEAMSDERYLDSPTLVGNYEVLYYDRSLDGGRDNGEVNPRRKGGVRQRLLRLFFRQRGSFQHIVDSDKLVNFLSFVFLGLSGRVVAEGTFSRLDADEIAEISRANGTALTSDTVRVTFGPPRVALAGMCFEITGAAAQPPVVLCTTYLDTQTTDAGIRLGLVAGGGRFVFSRGGKAAESFADEWKEVIDKPITDARLILGAALAVITTGVLRPMLAAQVLYAAGGIGIGFGGTKFIRFASSGAATAHLGKVLGALNPRAQSGVAQLRAALLKMDPSLADNEGESLSFGDLRGPFFRRRGGGKGGGGGQGRPPRPPWKKV